LDQYLCFFINKWQSNWYNLLPLAEFQYNNYIYSATQQLFFLFNTDHFSQMDFELHQQLSKLELVSEFVEWIKSTLEEKKAAFQKSQDNIALLSQNELLTCLWYLNLGYTLRGLGVIQNFNNGDNDNNKR